LFKSPLINFNIGNPIIRYNYALDMSVNFNDTLARRGKLFAENILTNNFNS
jgi:hypothetical protein